jgi:anti-sigma28 factor (negative regulator of flagellin synthesis)
MRINDNGFTERVATPAAPAAPPPETGKVAGSNTTTGSQATAGTSDNLQLSGFAARLNSGQAADTSNRADNVSRIADAVNAGTFRIDTTAVSRSIIVEGLQSKR